MTSTYHRASVLGFLMVVAATTVVPGAELHLMDDRIVAGELVPDNHSDMISLRIPLGTSVGLVSFPRAEVRRIDHFSGTTALQRLALIRQVESVSHDADPAILWQLAKSAKEHSMPALAKRCAELVLMADRHNATAAQWAGMRLVRGVYMRPQEAALARGEVFHGGRWMTWDERAAQEKAVLEQSKRQAKAIEELHARLNPTIPPPVNPDQTSIIVVRTVTWPTPRVWGTGNSYAGGNGYAGGQSTNRQAGPNLVISGQQGWSNGSVSWRFSW